MSRYRDVESTGVIKIADFGLSKSVKLGKIAGRRESLDSGSGSGSGAPPPLAPPAGGGDAASNAGTAKSTSFKMTGETGSYRCARARLFLAKCGSRCLPLCHLLILLPPSQPLPNPPNPPKPSQTLQTL